MVVLLRPLLLLCVLLPRVGGLAVVGYVPEYRWREVDWDKAVRQTTHLVLFSLEPEADGGLKGLENIRAAMSPQSPLQLALEKVRQSRPKVLVTIGGAGRSEAFPTLAGSKKPRKRLAKKVVALMREFPTISGIDFDWQVPTDEEQWRDLGRLAQELRTAIGTKGSENPVITMTFHPLTGSVGKFAGLRGKSSDKGFVDLFDMCHAMTYSVMDNNGHHNSEKMDQETVREWRTAGLPLDRLTLGIPFFGVKKEGAPKTFMEIVTQEPELLKYPGVDASKDGFYFVNGGTAAEKVQYVAKEGLAGVMLWELGQDFRSDTAKGLLQHIWDAAQGASNDGAFFGFTLGEDQMFVVLTVIVGGYYTMQTLALAVQNLRVAQRTASTSAPTASESTEGSKEPSEEKKES